MSDHVFTHTEVISVLNVAAPTHAFAVPQDAKSVTLVADVAWSYNGLQGDTATTSFDLAADEILPDMPCRVAKTILISAQSMNLAKVGAIFKF